MATIINRVKRKVKKEMKMKKTFRKGYPRKTSSIWYNLVDKDNKIFKDKYSRELLDRVHSEGYLARSIEPLNLQDGKSDRITDLDYLYLRPFNNSFSKWIEDINTMTRMHPDMGDCLPKIYFTICNRNYLKILDFPFSKKERTVKDIVNVLKRERKTLELRPSFWNSKSKRYHLSFVSADKIKVNSKILSLKEFRRLLLNQGCNYILCEKINYGYKLTHNWKNWGFYKFYLVNDENKSYIACAAADIYEKEKRKSAQHLINLENGTFILNDKEIKIPNWEKITEKLVSLSSSMKQLNYFSVSITLNSNGFKICNCNYKPFLPTVDFNNELNTYLKKCVDYKRTVKIKTKDKIKAIKDRYTARLIEKFCRKGIRPYMQKLWFSAVKSDLLWKGTNLKQKIWAWKRGFLSYRIEQYGLTEDNYKNFLSDYDYHWLNRMNNINQVWISDKTTFRYTMEPVKEYIPAYYLSIFKRRGEVTVARFPDCPENIEETIDGAIELLKSEKILAFKPSAGLHGDGFYCLEYRDETFFINGNESDEENIKDLICAQRSIYILTSYIHMHEDLKAIYPTSVNSIRVMAINRHGFDPKIAQSYMRIGSSKTGYTDNVGYGGICAMIDIATGTLYDPETLCNHVYYPCPNHPDTGTAIAGIKIPRWEEIKKTVEKICRLFPELEYLGFDVAVTQDGINIMEINIHQDLHKVGKHSDFVRDYFKERIRYKKKLLKI